MKNLWRALGIVLILSGLLLIIFGISNLTKVANIPNVGLGQTNYIFVIAGGIALGAIGGVTIYKNR